MIDRVVIEISAGKGGDGLISFHRGKYLPFGGPDGGDGGKGGDVVVVGDDSYNDLTHLSAGKKYLARHGMSGGKDKRRGKSAENLKIQVPVVTGKVLSCIHSFKMEIQSFNFDRPAYPVGIVCFSAIVPGSAGIF